MKKSFASSAGTIVYTDTQTGHPTLILLHGLPTAKEIWDPVIPHLNAGYRVIALDLHDYGESAKIGYHISHKERAQVLDELRHHLELDVFHLIAHDLGASVAIDYMGAFGRHVQRLVLMSPPVYPDFVEPSIVKLVRIPGLGELLVALFARPLLRIGIQRGMVHKERFTPEIFGPIERAFSGREGHAALLRTLRWGTPQVTFQDYPCIIREIGVPTLVLIGRHDPYIPLAHAERLNADIADARLVVVEDGGHFLPMDKPEDVAHEINAFVG
jgi:pimeloyl-ACP methyl ester carboxylesterase